jgi:hypothetical protein
MPVSKAHIKATTKYESKAYDKILIRIRKENDPSGLSRESIQQAADKDGKSLNGYILQAVKEKMNQKKEVEKSE